MFLPVFLLLMLFQLSWQQSYDAQLEFETVKVYFPKARNWSSDAWRPAVYTSCFSGLHSTSAAPCRNIRNLIYAEELAYPDFRLRLPHFVSPEHRRIWVQIMNHHRHTWLRGRIIDEYGYFLNQHGQNLIYANVSYNSQPVPSRWGTEACMSLGANLHVDRFPPWDGNGDAPSAVFVSSPDDWSFQHFLDRVAVMLAQTHHLANTEEWSYITSPPKGHHGVPEMWSMLVPNFTTSRLIDPYRGGTRMRRFLYPCQSPLIHPYTQQLVSELLQQAAGFDPRDVVPLASRRVVLFLARRGTRSWANEDECRHGIESMMASRGKGEQLVNFVSEEFSSLKDIIKLARQVKVMVGVHGGAFYNLVFMQPGTALVEVCPVAPDHTSSRCGAAFWEMGSTRRLAYWNVVADDTSASWDIRSFDCQLVVTAVRQALEAQDGGSVEALSPLEPYHQGTTFNRRRMLEEEGAR